MVAVPCISASHQGTQGVAMLACSRQQAGRPWILEAGESHLVESSERPSSSNSHTIVGASLRAPTASAPTCLNPSLRPTPRPCLLSATGLCPFFPVHPPRRAVPSIPFERGHLASSAARYRGIISSSTRLYPAAPSGPRRRASIAHLGSSKPSPACTALAFSIATSRRRITCTFRDHRDGWSC